ncbi:caspase family protein [Alphaproteobacteria bacterium]|nr:caspase family protein [Alphaproteobacteria bacterium]
MIKKLLQFLLVIFFVPSIALGEINIMKYFTAVGNDNTCFQAISIDFTDEGLIKIKVFTNYYSECSSLNNRISFAEAEKEDGNKKNLIRKVEGIHHSGSVDKFIYFFVNPSIKYLTIVGKSRNNRTVEQYFNFSKYIQKLKLVHANRNWLNNLNASEEKLVEKKNSDKTPPKISIFNLKNNQRLDTYNLFVRGKVTDNQGILSVYVNGKKSGIKSDGTFASKVKLGLGKNKIKIQAEDVNNNVSEKSLTIIREEYISELTLADVDIPPKTQMNNPDALAVVIGIENYQYVPDATYAYNDAEVFREYLSQTLGFKKQRIKLATNSRATQAEINKLLGSNGWLSRNIVKAKSDVVVYFSGHGISNQNDKTTGVLPFDVDPNYSIGLSLKKLYNDLSSMGAKSVTVFSDTCFSGQSREANMLIADARPIVIVPKEKDIPDNINIFSASTGSQISGAIKEKEHGLFTYYLLKGLSGDSDMNKDKVIEFKELSSFVSENVRKQAAINGREQTPQFINNTGKVFVNLN